jgi:hypothetical protein
LTPCGFTTEGINLATANENPLGAGKIFSFCVYLPSEDRAKADRFAVTAQD